MITSLMRIFTFFLCSVMVISCAVNPVTGKKELMLVSESQEIEFGRELYPNALWGDIGGGGEYRDDGLKAYLNGIVTNLHHVSHRQQLPVEFAVQNSSVPNAWAIPGYVVMTRGLVAALDSEAEFAFVMGHEMGHVSARHSAQQMTYGMLQQVGLGVAGIALSGENYADLILGVGSIGSSLLLLKYSRDDELEADRLGILYMTKNGYDPQNAVRAHRNLEKISQEYLKQVGKDPVERGFFEDLLSTHPRTSVRIDEIQKMINSVGPVTISGDGTFRERYENRKRNLEAKNKLYLTYYDPAVRAFLNNNVAEADSLIIRALREDQTQPAFYTLKGFIMMKRNDYSEAERYFETALNIQNDYEPAYRGLGVLKYYQKAYPEGITYLKKSISIFPQDIGAHYILGMSYYQMKDCRSALPHLDLFSQVQAKHPEIHGLLGICYENRGNINDAYREYIMQLQVAPDNSMGRHAAERVNELRPYIEKNQAQ
jgi:predicted Zn-dependent protease